jgi:hypothetical protein
VTPGYSVKGDRCDGARWSDTDCRSGHLPRALAIMRAFVLFLVCVLACSAMAREKPPLPFYDWNACPFECCRYGSWTLRQSVSFHQSHAEGSRVTFRLEQGQIVTGITGVVITKRCGTTRATKSAEIVGIAKDGVSPSLSLKPGETICTLHSEGENESLFWYDGNLYSGELPDPEDSGKSPRSEELRTETKPVTEWWVMIKAASVCNGISCRAGDVGWSRETSAFEHMDACE